MQGQCARGVYLPLVTPFHEGDIDFESLGRLLDHYQSTGIAGIVLLGTTGEAAVLSEEEHDSIVRYVAEHTQGQLPLYLGVGGNDTQAVVDRMPVLAKLPVDGYLLTTPYYTRPNQAGLLAHFDAVLEQTDRNIIVYNIPYRTGTNLENESLFQLLERHPHIVGIKDSCGNIQQSMELLREGRDKLAVLAGDDPMFFTTVALGGAGGILAASHVAPRSFVQVQQHIEAGELDAARKVWDGLGSWVHLIFAEPNPAPLKAWLADHGLIRSGECRLPLTPVSSELTALLSKELPGGLSS